MHKPDFSGEWILNREASSLSPGADAIRSGVVRIEHRDPKFRYKGEFVSDNGKVQPEFELMSQEQADSAQQEMTSGASLRWEGDALLFSYAERHSEVSIRNRPIQSGRDLRA